MEDGSRSVRQGKREEVEGAGDSPPGRPRESHVAARCGVEGAQEEAEKTKLTGLFGRCDMQGSTIHLDQKGSTF